MRWLTAQWIHFLGDTIEFDSIRCIVTTDRNNAYICVEMQDAIPVCYLSDIYNKCIVIYRVSALWFIQKYGINTS